MESKSERMDNATLRYTRYCDDCEHYFKTDKKYSKVCSKCKEVNMINSQKKMQLVRVFGIENINL